MRLSTLLPACALACAPPPHPADTRAACGLAPGEDWHGEAPSAPCRAQLHHDFGVDPRAFRASELAALEESLLTGLASDYGTLRELSTEAPAFASELLDLAGRLSLPLDGPASDAVYALLADRIDSITIDPGLSLEARYDGGAVALTGVPTNQRPAGLATWALLAHEVGHAWQLGHVRCVDEPLTACDPHGGGPLGLEAVVARAYEDHASSSTERCKQARWVRLGACSRILDAHALPACWRPPQPCHADPYSSNSG